MRKLDAYTRSPSNVAVFGDQGNLAGPVGSYWSALGASVFWWSGYNNNGVGFDWHRHARNPRLDGNGFYGARIDMCMADGHAQTFEGSFGVYPGTTDVVYNSPETPYPFMKPYEPGEE
jgi:hypothetical protein